MPWTPQYPECPIINAATKVETQSLSITWSASHQVNTTSFHRVRES
jgi:hypothetical protein